MGDKSKIEWTDATWNPVTGCTKVSQGCRNCYALRDWSRLSANPSTVYFGRAFTDVECHADRLGIPIAWQKPRRIFVNSMSDLFHAAVPDLFIAQVFETMELCPRHTFQVLTKRPERMRQFIAARGIEVPAHVQLGVSCEDQLTWDERVPYLLATAAPVRFVSFEPLLGPIDCRGGDITAVADWPLSGIQWAIVGGESGPKARPTHPDWVRVLRDQCRIADVPFFFKQWGEWGPGEANAGPPTRTERVASWWNGEWDFGTLTPKQSAEIHADDAPDVYHLGRKVTGRMLDGHEYNEVPVR